MVQIYLKMKNYVRVAPNYVILVISELLKSLKLISVPLLNKFVPPDVFSLKNKRTGTIIR